MLVILQTHLKAFSHKFKIRLLALWYKIPPFEFTPIHPWMVVVDNGTTEIFRHRYAEAFASLGDRPELLPSIHTRLSIGNHSVSAKQLAVDDFGKHSSVDSIPKEYVFGNIYFGFCYSRHIILP